MWIRVNSCSVFTVVACVFALFGAQFSTQFSSTLFAAEAPYTWKSVVIGGGGFVTGIIPHPTVKGLIYCRTDVGGAYRWDSEAKQWVPLVDWVGQREWNYFGCEALAVDPNAPDRVYLALGTYLSQGIGNAGLARSADRGHTFQTVELPFKMGGNCAGRGNGERLQVDPNDGQVLFLGTPMAGLWTSNDAATTWKRVDSFPIPPQDKDNVGVNMVMFDPATGKKGQPTRKIYCGVSTNQNNFYRSIDGGVTWALVDGEPQGLRPTRIDRASDGMLYISYGDKPGPNEMSDGAIWKFDPTAGKWANVTPVKPGNADRFGYGCVSVDAQNPKTLIASSFCRWAHGDTIFRSRDGGQSWKEQTVGGGRRDVSLFDSQSAPYSASLAPHWLADVVIDPFDSNHAMFTTGFGIWASHDVADIDAGKPAHWSFADEGLEETVPLNLISPPAGAHLLSAIGDFDGFKHDDLDVSPVHGRYRPSIGTTAGLDFAEAVPNVIVRADKRGFISNDGGDHWTEFASVPRGTSGGGRIAISADAKAILWSPDGAMPSFSMDDGSTWTACTGLRGGVLPVADRVNAAVFYALDQRRGGVFVSTDAGKTFAPASQNRNGRGSALRATPGIVGDLWMIADEHLLHSTDAGKSFLQVPSMARVIRVGLGKAAPGENYPAVYTVAELNGGQGFYRSDDTGKSWTRINDDQHQFGEIRVIIGDPRIFGRVYIGTGGRGVLYGDIAGK